MNTWLAGSLVRVSAAFTVPDGTVNGRPADPAAITLRYQPYPGAEVVEVAYPDAPVTRDGTGLYHADLDTTTSPGGKFTYVWAGAGTVQAAGEGMFTVRTQFA